METNVRLVKEDGWMDGSFPVCFTYFSYSHIAAIILGYINCSFASPSLLFYYNILEGVEFNLLPYPLMLKVCYKMGETETTHET